MLPIRKWSLVTVIDLCVRACVLLVSHVSIID
jgi:hypothetical protein